MCNYLNFDKQNSVMMMCLYFMVVMNLNSDFTDEPVDKSLALGRFAQELVSPGVMSLDLQSFNCKTMGR